MNLRQVRLDCAAALAGLTVEALRDTDLTIYDVLPGSPEVPCVVVGWPTQVRYHRTLAGHHEFDLALTIAVPTSDTDAAQHALDELLGDTLIPAIESYPGIWRNVVAETAQNIRPETVGDHQVLAADLIFTFIA
jgi:hypothetical protein